MSTDMSDIAELRRALKASVQLDKVEKKAAIDGHSMASKRIFPASGGSKDKEDRRLGNYSPATMKIRRKAGWSGRAVVLQFTRQLIHSWNVIIYKGVWTSLFLIQGRRGSNQSNDQVANDLERRYGDIFFMTDKEEDYFVKQLEKYQEKLLNK